MENNWQKYLKLEANVLKYKNQFQEQQIEKDIFYGKEIDYVEVEIEESIDYNNFKETDISLNLKGDDSLSSEEEDNINECLIEHNDCSYVEQYSVRIALKIYLKYEGKMMSKLQKQTILGIGGGGCNTLQDIANFDDSHTMVYINNDKSVLERIESDNKFLVTMGSEEIVQYEGGLNEFIEEKVKPIMQNEPEQTKNSSDHLSDATL